MKPEIFLKGFLNSNSFAYGILPVCDLLVIEDFFDFQSLESTNIKFLISRFRNFMSIFLIPKPSIPFYGMENSLGFLLLISSCIFLVNWYFVIQLPSIPLISAYYIVEVKIA